MKLKTNKGITLIALVITIIVLLILAAVSIATLTGENGILGKAEEAKVANSEAEIEERIKVEVMGSYDKEGKLNADTVTQKITKNISGATVQGTEFPLTIIYGDSTYTVEPNGKVSEYVEPEIKGNAKEIAENFEDAVGKVVSNYTAKNEEWQIFYADNNNVYLIAKEGIYSDRGVSELSYNGTSDLADLSNFPTVKAGWLSSIYNNGSIVYSSDYSNMKSTVYLLDSTQWSEYKEQEYADYAIGGPTVEMFSASLEAAGKPKLNYSLDNVGYKVENYQKQVVGSAWNNGTYYWIAAPSADAVRYVWMMGGNDEGIMSESNNVPDSYFRPVVCLNSNVILTLDETTGEYEMTMGK